MNSSKMAAAAPTRTTHSPQGRIELHFLFLVCLMSQYGDVKKKKTDLIKNINIKVR